MVEPVRRLPIDIDSLHDGRSSARTCLLHVLRASAMFAVTASVFATVHVYNPGLQASMLRTGPDTVVGLPGGFHPLHVLALAILLCATGTFVHKGIRAVTRYVTITATARPSVTV